MTDEHLAILEDVHGTLKMMKDSREPMSDTERRLIEVVGVLVELQLAEEARSR